MYKRQVIIQRSLRDQDAPSMNREVVGKSFHQLAIAEDMLGEGMMLRIGERFIDDGVDIRFRKPKDLAEFADDGFALEGIVCCRCV